jgi:hypothetical protein
MIFSLPLQMYTSYFEVQHSTQPQFGQPYSLDITLYGFKEINATLSPSPEKL